MSQKPIRLCQKFNHNKYYKANDGYYKLSRSCGATCMHRDVWEYHNGQIIKGYDIHHKDENRSNNKIENLESLTRKEHRAKHLLSGIAVWSKEQHSKKSTNQWKNKVSKIHICKNCEKEYSSFGQCSMFCTPKCRKAFYKKYSKKELAAASL